MNLISTTGKFLVDLKTGAVVYSDNTPDPWYKVCDSLTEADYYSLNVLRQNIREQEFRTETTISATHRVFLGARYEILSKDVIAMMQYLKAHHTEDFL
jgi:ethanolamine utilization cobalamin adenosyltransferase